MKISNIFVLVPYSLYTVQFGSEDRHEFTRQFEIWNDTSYLEAFFESHKEDLLAFWPEMTIENAIIRTKQEAGRLESLILKIAERGASNKLNGLSTLFRPLHNGTQRIDPFEKSKSKGDYRDSWLRIYAVRIDVNLFVISGGAIKLTRTMNERAHLINELHKMEAVCRFLKTDQGDDFEIFELF